MEHRSRFFLAVAKNFSKKMVDAPSHRVTCFPAWNCSPVPPMIVITRSSLRFLGISTTTAAAVRECGKSVTGPS